MSSKKNAQESACAGLVAGWMSPERLHSATEVIIFFNVLAAKSQESFLVRANLNTVKSLGKRPFLTRMPSWKRKPKFPDFFQISLLGIIR
jgi:hypothetical protein